MAPYRLSRLTSDVSSVGTAVRGLIYAAVLIYSLIKAQALLVQFVWVNYDLQFLIIS